MQNTFYPLASQFNDKVMLLINKDGSHKQFLGNCHPVLTPESRGYVKMAHFIDENFAKIFERTEFIYCEVVNLSPEAVEKFSKNTTPAEISYKNVKFVSGQVQIFDSPHEAENSIKILNNNLLYIFYVTNKAWSFFDFLEFSVEPIANLKITTMS